MTDPYSVLGVSRNASDDEIKKAYRELAKKYHPDQYNQTPLADLAGEKMSEVNSAYDQIMNERSGGNRGGSGYYGGNAGGSQFSDVRNLIHSGRIADAEQILSGIPEGSRNAEWYFLKGTIFYNRGWMDQAYSHMQRACQMEPNNPEYRNAFNQMNNRRRGNYGGYNTTTSSSSGCGTCDICCSLICMDSCCECMGGDLIPCC